MRKALYVCVWCVCVNNVGFILRPCPSMNATQATVVAAVADSADSATDAATQVLAWDASYALLRVVDGATGASSGTKCAADIDGGIFESDCSASVARGWKAAPQN